ncbi:MAG: 8-amino-7-oxononanoate synthase [Polyangiaceae bacterium]
MARLKEGGLFRDPNNAGFRQEVQERAATLGVPFVDASSNDYLGLARGGTGRAPSGLEIVSREIRNADGLLESEGWRGAGASRLLGGSDVDHCSLEAALADWVGTESALTFSSGYAGNLGVLSSVPGEADVVFSDSLNHASIVDGCRLGRARVSVYPHLNLDELRKRLRTEAVEGQRWVVSESYFSMDGDSPDLVKLREICDECDAGLIVDEAHALGVFGPVGQGLCSVAGISPDVTLGAFGKAVGVQGGFAAGAACLREWLWNRARSFVFSTAPGGTVARRVMFHVKHVQAEHAARMRLAAMSLDVRGRLDALGLKSIPGSHGPIIPVLIGGNEAASRAAAELRSIGVLAYPVRPPTVPQGTARLRITLSARMSSAEIDHLVDALGKCCRPI